MHPTAVDANHKWLLGARHAGVLTKLDIMDRGTDASAILRNEVVPLRLGYTGLVCRSQADIIARRSMREARAAEQAFFEGRPEYHEVSRLPARSLWLPGICRGFRRAVEIS